MTQARLAPSSAPAALNVNAVNEARRQKLLENLNNPTPKFLKSLLQPDTDADYRKYALERGYPYTTPLLSVMSEAHISQMRVDIALVAANVDKEKLIETIKKLDKELRDGISYMAQRAETCFGILFAAHQEKFAALVAPDVNIYLEKAYYWTWNAFDSKQEFSQKAYQLAPNNPAARAAVIGFEARALSHGLVDPAPGKVVSNSVCGRDGEKVLQQYRDVLALQPDTAPVYFYMGLLQVRRRNNAEALACFTKALSITSDLKLNPRQQAEAYAQQTIICVQLAQQYYQQVLTNQNRDLILVRPAYASIYLHIGCFETSAGNYDNAVRYLTHALDIASDLKLNSGERAQAFHQRGISHSLKGRYDAAIADYQAAMKLSQDDKILASSKEIDWLAYQTAIQQSSIYFFQELLKNPNKKMFDITNKAIDKEKLFLAINALQDKRLKQSLLCQMLSKETFLGKLFYKQQDNWDQWWVPSVKRGKLEDAVKVLCKVIDAKEELELDKETIAVLVQDKALQTASFDLQKIYKHVAMVCKRKALLHENKGEYALALEAYNQAGQLDSSLAALVGDFNKRLAQHTQTSATTVEPSAPAQELVVDPIRSFLLGLLEEKNFAIFFNLMLKPVNFKKLFIHDIDKSQLLEVLKALADKNLKKQVLRQALLPDTFFNKVFAENQIEFAELFIEEVGLQNAVADEAIKNVFLNSDFQKKLAQQNPKLCDDLRALLGVEMQVVVVVVAAAPTAVVPENVAALPESSAAAIYLAFGVSPAEVSHNDFQPGAAPNESEPGIRPDCDGAQPAAAAAAPKKAAQSRRQVVMSG